MADSEFLFHSGMDSQRLNHYKNLIRTADPDLGDLIDEDPVTAETAISLVASIADQIPGQLAYVDQSTGHYMEMSVDPLAQSTGGTPYTAVELRSNDSALLKGAIENLDTLNGKLAHFIITTEETL